MLPKKRVDLTSLISYVLSFAEKTIDNTVLESIFPDQVKSNDEFSFNSLNYGKTSNISNFPIKLKLIMDPYLKEIVRHGINTKFDNDIDLSLYASVLFHVIPNYQKLSEHDQYDCIIKLRDKLIIYISNNDNIKFNNYGEELGWVKKDIVDSLVKFKTNKVTLKLIADYFYLNIFLFNVIEDKIYVVSENNSYDMFRKSIMLVLNESTFEPMVYNNILISEYTSGPIKKLVTVDKKFLVLLDTNLKDSIPAHFTIRLSDISKYLKEENKPEQSQDTDNQENEYAEVIPNESDANAYIKDIESTEKEIVNKPQLVFNISQKMKLSEIQDIAKKLNIDLNNGPKKKTKIELMNEINSVLKK
ncbi:hypothetical protein Indivirus_2_12 [Indivirus ILV1]|uniref:Uncharacterized protein n=1 Tax=Indivirus ILV1 TaxID=1977633 RepID=A0A1V0SD33_9VIRU|nr:hypothetical protein Indivirus_2_12 [Indivirus ILV1]